MSSLSATSIAVNRQQPVSLAASTPLLLFCSHTPLGHLIYKCGGIDKRTIEKFEKVCGYSYCTFSRLKFDTGRKNIIGVGGACTPLLARELCRLLPLSKI